MRVVSLLPAATEIVAALGAGGALVGVSHECDYPPEVRRLPRVTRARIDVGGSSAAIDRAVTQAKQAGEPAIEVDVDLVARLRPDVIIGQSVCDVCAVGAGELERLVATLMPTPWVVTLHAHTLEGVFVELGKVGDAVELADEAEELVAGLRYRLRRVHQTPSAHPTPPRVLVLEWLDPPYVAGHWVPELVELAGGRAVARAAGEPSRPYPWPELAALDPDLVVIALCGFDVARARGEFAGVTDGAARALFTRRLEFLDGNAYTSRPGPRLVDAAEIMARWLRS
jgi:iron complex transport system substrate-binding protein